MRRRKRDIVIELTALLDVIMIMIFMVMHNNSKLVSETQSELDRAQQENAEQSGVIDDLNGQIEDLSAELAEALQQLDEDGLGDLWEQLRDAENRLEGYQSMDEVVTVLNISLENKRIGRAPSLTFGNPADSERAFESYDCKTDGEFAAAVNRLKVFISPYASQSAPDDPDAPTVYVIFSYDPDQVYQQDFLAIDNALKDAERKANSANFQYRLLPSNKQP